MLQPPPPLLLPLLCTFATSIGLLLSLAMTGTRIW